MERLEFARETLRFTLERSKDLAFRIDETGPRLERTSQRLAMLESEISEVARKCSVCKIRAPINHVFGLSASVLRIYEVVCCSGNSLLSDDPSADLLVYLKNVKDTEDALRFLNSYCRLMIPWLEEAQQILESNAFTAESRYLENVEKCVVALEELQGMEGRFRSRGGALVSAMDKLESELARLLLENRIEGVEVIVERLAANDRLERCISVYVEIRGLNVRGALQALDLDYLESPLTELNVEQHIEQWGRHLEYAVKHVFEFEHRLCSLIFGKLGSEISMDCFSKIAVESGIQSFFEFGNSVARGKKEAIKLLKLLEIFSALNNLRSDFNRLFNAKQCVEIQNLTRDLIKNVVNRACEIFWELHLQVELQTPSSPPIDCGVPRLVTFVTDFINQLLEDEYWLTLLQIVEIHFAWNNKNFDKKILSDEINNIVIALEQNLEIWGRKYKDSIFTCIFMMNHHWYLSKYAKGTKLGALMGRQWLRAHEVYMEYYEAVFLNSSWRKLSNILSDKDQILVQNHNALIEFTEVFDSMYQRQSNVVLCDKDLRSRTHELVLQVVIPPYKSYIDKYAPEIELNIKYAPESLESMIYSLFQPKFDNFSSIKCTELIGKVNNVVGNPISSTTAAA